jgi:hypothetical protein
VYALFKYLAGLSRKALRSGLFAATRVPWRRAESLSHVASITHLAPKALGPAAQRLTLSFADSRLLVRFGGAVMKKIRFGALMLSTALSGSAAFAGQNDDLVARLNAAEQENTAIRRQNMELAAAKPASFTDRMADFFGAYAADLPVAYKARPPEEPGRFRAWVEGGAIWTGGDPVSRAFSLTDFTTNSGRGENGPVIPGIFDLSPKVGWVAATGFDYKFAGSPWHVSGQFRYGQSGTASGSASSAGTLDPSLLPNNTEGFCFSPIADDIFPRFFPNRRITACGGSQSTSVTYKETHWLTDLALGYDIAGHGPTYVQVKGGLRIEEFLANRTTNTNQTNFVNFATPAFITCCGPTQPTFTALSVMRSATFTDRNNFLGAGPLIGLEGSVRFLGAWSFDYKGDLAVLFGTQSEFETNISRTTSNPALLGITNSNFSGAFSSAFTDEKRFVTMLSGDIQAGVSYWFTPNVKLGASYRIDTLIAVKNTKSANAESLVLPQRYWHGPLVTLTGQFTPN